MEALAVLIVIVIGVVGAWHHRRRRDHEPRLLLLPIRRHGPACGCEACLENYADAPLKQKDVTIVEDRVVVIECVCVTTPKKG